MCHKAPNETIVIYMMYEAQRKQPHKILENMPEGTE